MALDLGFLREQARDPARPQTPAERAAIATAHDALAQADAMVVRLGGKAGRLGECIAATGILEGVLAALRHVGRAAMPCQLVVDEGAAELFDAVRYRERGWTGLRVSASPTDAALDLWALGEHEPGEHRLILDLHGAHDDWPTIERLPESAPVAGRRMTALAHLARVGLRAYAVRGPERRYADFVTELFGLPSASIAGSAAQPRILLGASDLERFPGLARTLGLDPRALLVVCCFQSVVIAKCYERWDEVLAGLCARLAVALPGQRVDFVVACGPDDRQPPGFAQADLTDWLGGFTGTGGNARVRFTSIPSLRDLAVVLAHAALALVNDTGPGHLAGALGIPTVTPYLPGDLYSWRVWASTLWHHGVTLDPNPYTTQQLEAAVIWDHTDIINAIPPDDLVNPAFDHIMAAARSSRQRYDASLDWPST